ncbi:unnamed protein product, partial [Discosporangium mesarthrocarpum]
MASNEAGTKRAVADECHDRELKAVCVDTTHTEHGAGKSKISHPPPRRGVQVDVITEDTEKLVDFLTKVVGAREYFRHAEESGKITHAALDINGVAVFAADKGSLFDKCPKDVYVRLNLNTPDPEALGARMVNAGATVVVPCEEQFWGSKYGQYADPFGQIWNVASTSQPTEVMPKPLQYKVAPFLSVNDATAYIKWLQEALGAETVKTTEKTPEGKVMCATLELNDGGIVMVSDKFSASEGTDIDVNIALLLEPQQAAPTAKRFEVNGGEIVNPPTFQFWGQVWGKCKGPHGVNWSICEPPTVGLTDIDYTVDVKLGTKHGWKWSWSVEEVPSTHIYGEVRTVGIDDLMSAFEEIIPAAFRAAAGSGVTLTGGTAGIYYSWEEKSSSDEKKAGMTTFTAGPLVAAAGAPGQEGDGYHTRTIGGEKMAVTTHTGPYEELKGAWYSLFEWATAKGYQPTMPGLEIY